MTVFKAYMKITKRNMGLVFLYVSIFMLITAAFQFEAEKNKEKTQYTASRVKIGVIDEDQGVLAKGLQTYLEQFHTLVPVTDEKGELQEKLYYRKVEYIIRISEGFEYAILEQREKLKVTKVPNSYTGFYVDQQIDSFLNNIKAYYEAGYSTDEAVKGALLTKQAEVKVLEASPNGEKKEGYTFFYRYLPYPILSILCYVFGKILAAFRNGNIQKRMQASALSDGRKNGETLLATAFLGLILWCSWVVISILLYKNDFLRNSSMGYYLLNSFAMLLSCMSIAYLIGILANNVNALNGIVNVVSMGMCLLCGVFVPLEFLGRGVKMGAQFLPLYWYEKANELLIKFDTITGAAKNQVWQAVGIQILFAGAITCVAVALSKNKRQEC